MQWTAQKHTSTLPQVWLTSRIDTDRLENLDCLQFLCSIRSLLEHNEGNGDASTGHIHAGQAPIRGGATEIPLHLTVTSRFTPAEATRLEGGNRQAEYLESTAEELTETPRGLSNKGGSPGSRLSRTFRGHWKIFASSTLATPFASDAGQTSETRLNPASSTPDNS